MNIETGISDPALFYKMDERLLICICSTNIDDNLGAVTGDNTEFGKHTFEQDFELKDRAWNNIQFTRLQVERDTTVAYIIKENIL